MKLVGSIKSFIFALITIVLSLVVIDLVLHAAAFVSPQLDDLTQIRPGKVPDERLVNRPNPRHPDHDDSGFRNPREYNQADIVALGDSQTYGSGVAAQNAWPRVLEGMVKRPVYSMASGGYGPAHSLLLWDDAMALKPEIIVAGLYSGNDFYDTFSLVYNHGRADELINPDSSVVEQMHALQADESIRTYISNLRRRGRVKSESADALEDWLDENSRVFGTLKRLQFELRHYRDARKAERSAEEKWSRAQKFASKYSEYVEAFESELARTVFTPRYRLAALDLNDPRISEGQRIAFEAIQQMQQKAKQAGLRFLVLLIPTKELVFAEIAMDSSSDHYRQLIDMEERAWREVHQFLDSQGIEYLDALPALRAELNSGNQPYKVSHDGHPNEIGYAAIARAVESRIAPHTD